MAENRPNYIVTAPAYNQNNGGGIFLHELVHTLNSFGERAFLWPLPPLRRPLRHRISHFRRDPIGYFKKPPYAVHPDLDTPVAQKSDFKPNSIVVYPEIVLGNPFGARNVVRWLLYKPGLLHPYKFGAKDMFFRADVMSDLSELTGGAPDLFLWKVNPAYSNQNRADRKGACYIVRKGKEKPRIRETEDAIQVDGLSHEEMAEIFNRCEVFYSYDEATFYSQYAALCGCLSVIIPGLYASRQEWAEQHELGKYGIAYGLDDIEHALATRQLVQGLLQQKEADGPETVKNFIALTQDQFGVSKAPANG